MAQVLSPLKIVKDYGDAPPTSIVIILQKHALFDMYSTHVYHDTAPICIAIRLQKHLGSGVGGTFLVTTPLSSGADSSSEEIEAGEGNPTHCPNMLQGKNKGNVGTNSFEKACAFSFCLDGCFLNLLPLHAKDDVKITCEPGLQTLPNARMNMARADSRHPPS